MRKIRRFPKSLPEGSRDPWAETVDSRLAALEEAVEENRRLNQRLADVIDVVTELLVPLADRDQSRVESALGRLEETLDE